MEAKTVTLPDTVFAVNVVDACPELLVGEAPPKVPLALEPGALNVTVTPGTVLPPESVTVTTRGLA